MVADAVFLDEDNEERDSVNVNHIDDTSSGSTRSSPSPIDGGRKRKLMVLSKDPAKKSNMTASPSALDLVDKTFSTITEEEVRRLFKTANISSTEFEFLVPSKYQRANRPPEGYISVYAEQIAAGLRFPMHDMVVRVCNLMKVSPSQLMPNAHRMIVAFILCAKFYGIPLTEGYFCSLFFGGSSKAKGQFYIRPRVGMNFTPEKNSDYGPWKKKFFFLRRKGNSWKCITKWRETLSRLEHDSSLAGLAVEKGIMDHHFRVNELTSKEILIHGGIEPGVPSPEFTFRYLMHKAAVTKFDLLPEDKPHAHATIEGVKTPSTAPLTAHNNPLTLLASSVSPDQPSGEHPVKHQQSLLTPTHTKVPSTTPNRMPIREYLSVSSEDNIPLNNLFGKENQNQECGSCEARVETNSTLMVTDEAKRQSFPTGQRTLLQTIESSDVAKVHYQKLEKDIQVLSSELKYAKSRIEELEQELELSDAKLEASEAKRAELENMHYLTNDAMKNLEKRVKNIKSDSDRCCEKIMKDATEAADRVLKKGLEKLNLELERRRDQIAKDAIQAFKSSDEFLNASTYNMDAFDVNFLNLPTDDATNRGQSIKSAEKRYKAICRTEIKYSATLNLDHVVTG